MKLELLDSHAHYNDEQFDIDREEIIQKIYNAGITTIINAGYCLESSKKAVEIARTYKFIYATIRSFSKRHRKFKFRLSRTVGRSGKRK